jgi:hypothetical protein
MSIQDHAPATRTPNITRQQTTDTAPVTHTTAGLPGQDPRTGLRHHLHTHLDPRRLTHNRIPRPHLDRPVLAPPGAGTPQEYLWNGAGKA